MRAGHNQYAPMEGVIGLREQIAAKLEAVLRRDASTRRARSPSRSARPRRSTPPSRPWSAPGDEAIVFDPAYDSYDPAVRLAGGALRAHPAHAAGVSLRLGSRARAHHGAHAADHLQQPRTIRPARSPARRIWMRWRRSSAAATSTCCPTRSTSTWSYDGASTSLGARAPGAARSAASRCSRSARRCTPPACASATAWRRRSSRASCARCTSSTPSASRTPLQHAIATISPRSRTAGAALAEFFQAKRDRLRAALDGHGFGCRRRRAPTSSSSTTAPSPPADDVAFAERLLTEGGRRHHSAVAVLPGPAAAAVAAAVHRQAGQHPR